MKTITVPGSDSSFDIDVQPGQANARYEVAVYVTAAVPLAVVAVYHDGDAEVVWQTGAETYRDRSAGWWADLATEVAKVVAR